MPDLKFRDILPRLCEVNPCGVQEMRAILDDLARRNFLDVAVAAEIADSYSLTKRVNFERLAQNIQHRRLLTKLIADEFGEMRRIVFVHVPKCAGSHVTRLLSAKYPVLPQRLDLEASGKVSYGFFSDILKSIANASEKQLLIPGHRKLLEAVKSGLLRKQDHAFSFFRDPLGIILSMANYVLTVLSEDKQAKRQDSKRWISQYALDPGKIGVDPQYALKLLRNPDFLKQGTNLMSRFLGRGTAATAIQMIEEYDVQMIPVEGTDEFLSRQWGIAPTEHKNVSRKFVKESDLSSNDVDELRNGVLKEDTELFGILQSRYGTKVSTEPLPSLGTPCNEPVSENTALRTPEPVAKPKKSLELLKFVVVGFPKCATSFVINLLGEFPETRVHSGEPGYFGGRMSLEDYLRPFEPGMINGEKSPGYIYGALPMQAIAQVKDVKIIVCLRHPIRWLESFYNFRRERPTKKKPNEIYSNACSLTDIIKNNLTVAGVGVERAHFAKFIRKNLQPYFRKEQVLYLVQEELKENTRMHMEQVCAFLGLDKLHLEGIKTRVERRAPYIVDFDADIEYVNLRKTLARRYHAYNNELYEVLGRTIPSWEQIDAKLLES